MKLPFEHYNPLWKTKFEAIKEDLQLLLISLHPQVDHIGSTAVEGLSAKPIIDIQVGVENEEFLDQVPILLKLPNLVYYEKYNDDMPSRRFFILFNKTVKEMGTSQIVKLNEEIPAILHDHDLRIAHIHVFVRGAADWTRHLAFRDYLRSHRHVKDDYQQLKQKLVEQNWQDGNEYNEAKDTFLMKYERIAVEWYRTK